MMLCICGQHDEEITEFTYRERVSNRLLVDSYLSTDELAEKMASSIRYQLGVALRSRRNELIAQQGAKP